MTDADGRVTPPIEIATANITTPNATRSETMDDTVSTSNDSSSTLRPPAALSAPPSIPRLFKGSGLRRPAKIQRLAKQQSSVSSTMGDTNAVESQASFSSKMTARTTAPSSTLSSRETTPFSSPLKPASRLREPKQIIGRKRSRDETGKTMASVAARLLQQEHLQLQRHSEDLSVATTHEDAVSHRDDEDASVLGSQSTILEEEETDEQKRAQQITIAKALQRELLRDRARLRLKIRAMKDDVETYYELLARMEQVTVAVAAQYADATERNEDKERRGAVVKMAERIQAIISARRIETIDVVETKPERADKETVPPFEAQRDRPREGEVEEY